MLETLADQLRSGELDIPAAAALLRARKSKPFSRLADWLEARPVTATVAATVLVGVAGIVSTQVIAQEQSPSQPGPSDQQIVQIVETVLDHYDQTHHLGQYSKHPPERSHGKATK
jgi:hypothetical protein